jgi:gliding motility-associated lipoprotein GldH
MRRNKHWICLILLTVALAIASCNRKTIYHHYEHTPVSGWEKNDTLQFNIPAAKERAVAQREVELRVTGAYPFQSICLIVEQTTLPSHIFRRDTITCTLMSTTGDIKGKGISLYQYRFPMSDISLNEGDSLSITIRHNMKREILPGITDIGIHLNAY